MGVIGENIAMAGATRTSTGGPYVRRTVVFEELLDAAGGPAGVAVTRIQQDTKNPPVRVLDPGHPHADTEGYVTYPNVNIVAEMVDFNIARRAYEANLAVFRAYRNMVRNAIANLSR
jgi:flagellar basal-body rod protein FlgC